MRKKLYLLLNVLFICSLPAISQITLTPFSLNYSNPVDIKNCGDDRMFIVEQTGTIQICDAGGVKNVGKFLNITDRVKYGGEQGLLGLAFPDDYQTSRYFYVYYNAKPSGYIHISRFRTDSLNPNHTDSLSEQILLNIYHPYTNHNGGHLAFGHDGYLYIGTGDGGSAGDPQNRAQNPDSLLGKLLRIEVDPSYPGYHIPQSNPFAQDTTLGRPEIWALGMRNPWRWSFDRLTGELLIGDVGQDAIEEIDFQPATHTGTLNYGWRCYEGNQAYNLSGNCQPQSTYIAPVYTYPHTTPMTVCSVTGGYRYRGSKYQDLYGKYFFTDYCLSHIRYLESNGSGGWNHTDLGILGGASSIVSWGEDRVGELYCAGGSTIYKLSSANCAPVSTINAGLDTITDCGTGHVTLTLPSATGYSYLWTMNGDTVSTSNPVTVTQAGTYYVTVADTGSCNSTDSIHVDLVNPLNLTFGGLDTIICVYHPTVNLLPNYLGGTFTGPGINGATFNPTAAGIGFFSITYTYTDAAGCTYSHTQDVHVDGCLGVPENTWTNSIGVYPNPSSGNFSVKAFSSIEKNVRVSIMDISGRLLADNVYRFNEGDNSFKIDQQLAKGVYVIRFADDKSSSSVKLVVQ